MLVLVHVKSNILLHAVTGLDGAGKAIFTPVFHAACPTSYDPGLIFIPVSGNNHCITFIFTNCKKVQEDLETSLG